MEKSKCSRRRVEARHSACCYLEPTGSDVMNSQESNFQFPIIRHSRTRVGSWLAIVLGVGISAASAAGCAKARAATVPDGPPLAMPLPPPRVFAPVGPEEPLAAGPAVPETPTT